MSRPHFGLSLGNLTFPAVPDSGLFGCIAAIAGTAEGSGLDSFWVMDHFYQISSLGPPQNAMLEAYVMLGGVAARTERIQIGALVSGVTHRNPALLAKMATTLDIVSGGRAILGLGAAWNDLEHAGYGIEFPPLSERMDRLDEALQICRRMFSEERPSFVGRHYRIERALNNPRPLRAAGIPIMVGGGGEKRTLRAAARYADMCNFFGDPKTAARKLEVLARHCEAAGRDPATIVKTGFMPVFSTANPGKIAGQVKRYLDAGLDGMIFAVAGAEALDPVARLGEALKLL